MTMVNDIYSDYMSRRPSNFGEKMIRRWHKRLFETAIADIGFAPSRVLEIGPGHGFLAEYIVSQDIEYFFCDQNVAVAAELHQRGFSGLCGSVDQIPDLVGQFQLIWVSHVLEHMANFEDARMFVSALTKSLGDGGRVVIVSPDIKSWKQNFWNIDWSHGFPTSLRRVVQLVSDVGLEVDLAVHHRLGTKAVFPRIIAAVLSAAPHQLIDRIISPRRSQFGDGPCYSWKAVFGWRQILVIAHN